MWGTKVMHVFLHGKKERGWSGIYGATIGYVYPAEKSGDRLTLSKRPKRLSFSERPQTEIEEWEAQDMATQAVMAERRAETAIRKNLPLTQKIEQLKPLLKKLSWSQRKALYNYLCGLEWKE